MYSAKFISDTSKIFAFGVDGGNIFDIEGLSGLSVELGKSQSSGQLGESVINQSITGKNINITGKIFSDNLNLVKNNLVNTILPMSRGQLIINNKYYIYVVVNTAPEVSPTKDKGLFAVSFFAPYPFFRSINQVDKYIGGITPKFSFPINYEEPHMFGDKSEAVYALINNSGNIKVPYKITITSLAPVNDVTITNLKTFQFMRVLGQIDEDDTVQIYRDENNILKAELTTEGVTTDILSRIDEDSNLFYLNVGDNIIQASDDEGGQSLTARIEFSPAWSAIYES